MVKLFDVEWCPRGRAKDLDERSSCFVSKICRNLSQKTSIIGFEVGGQFLEIVESRFHYSWCPICDASCEVCERQRRRKKGPVRHLNDLVCDDFLILFGLLQILDQPLRSFAECNGLHPL